MARFQMCRKWFPCLLLLGSVSAAAGDKALRLEDIIEQREPQSPKISPDGRTIAFLIRQGSVSSNSYRTSLNIVTPGSQPRKLLEETSVSQLQWLPDSSSLTAVLPRGGKVALWRIPLDSGEPRALFQHPTPVNQYRWSPDGSRLIFVVSEPVSQQEQDEVAKRGTVYDDTVFGIRNFISRTWTRPKPPRLWLWESRSGKADPIDLDLSPVAGIRDLAWSPDGSGVAVEYVPGGGPHVSINVSHIAVINLVKPFFRPVVTWQGANRGIDWSADSRSIVFASMGDTNPSLRFYENRTRPHVLRLGDETPGAVPNSGAYRFLSTSWWDSTGKNILLEYEDRSRSTLYRLPVAGGAVEPVLGGSGHFSSFHFDSARREAACIFQAFTVPPEIAFVDLETGKYQVLTDLNPALKERRLAAGRELQWKNRYGNSTNGFLMLPPDRKSGAPLPLLVILYHFSNKFTTQAQWMTSYPAQHFASAGFAVLLMNYPYELGWRYGDFETAALSQAYNPLASIEKAVEMLVADGTADPKRKGILGWSFGAWLTEFSITHSDLFQAASAGEGGLNNAGQYWVTGSAVMRYYLDGLFGGPPLGATYRNYDELSPALNAHRIKAPLLREYGPDVGIQSLELYGMMKRLGKPVEQVIYPNAPHVLDLPSHRLASMQRNLDWFRFWLQDYEDPDPAKRDQYSRWRAMRSLRSARGQPE